MQYATGREERPGEKPEALDGKIEKCEAATQNCRGTAVDSELEASLKTYEVSFALLSLKSKS